MADDTLAFNLAPPLSTVRQPIETIGCGANETALVLVEGRKVAAETVRQSELLTRALTAAPVR